MIHFITAIEDKIHETIDLLEIKEYSEEALEQLLDSLELEYPEDIPHQDVAEAKKLWEMLRGQTSEEEFRNGIMYLIEEENALADYILDGRFNLPKDLI